MPKAICSLSECMTPAKTRGLCPLHYMRWYRHGDPRMLRPVPQAKIATNGYVYAFAPDHPLRRGASRYVAQHRQVMYDACAGRCPARCYWCHAPLVGWEDAQVDHVDHDRAHNLLANLRVACLSCNVGRDARCDMEGWIRGVAARRVLNAHADEVARELDRLRADAALMPVGVSQTARDRRRQDTRAARQARV